MKTVRVDVLPFDYAVPGYPAHPAFAEGIEAAWRARRAHANVLRESAYRIPSTVNVAPADMEALGVPDLSSAAGANWLDLLVTRLGNLPLGAEKDRRVALYVKKGFGPGVMAFYFGGIVEPIFFYRWRCCQLHEDCKENPELGAACQTAAFARRASRGRPPPLLVARTRAGATWRAERMSRR